MLETVAPGTGDAGQGSLPRDSAGDTESSARLVDDADKLHKKELPQRMML